VLTPEKRADAVVSPSEQSGSRRWAMAMHGLIVWQTIIGAFDQVPELSQVVSVKPPGNEQSIGFAGVF